MSLHLTDDAPDVRHLMLNTSEAYHPLDASRVVHEAARRGNRRKRLRATGTVGMGVAVASLVAAVLVQGGVGDTAVEEPTPAAPVPSTSERLTGAPPPVSDWQPATPLSESVEMSEAEKVRERRALLGAEARGLGLRNPPRIDLVRWISPEEWAPSMLGCLTGQGLPVGYTADGGIDSSRVPSNEQPALQLAMYSCTAQFTVDPRYSMPLNAEQRGILYDFLTTSYVPCLGGLGIEVAVPPSRQRFIAAGDDDGWQPQLGLPRGRVTEANAACPVRPRSEVLYGS